jgi:hypothetical protein
MQILLVGIPAVSAIIGASFTKLSLACASRKISLIIGASITILGSALMIIPY